MRDKLKAFLDAKVHAYNQPSFIADDPISIPHRYTKMQDIEIAGFFASLLAWGNRKSILNSCNKLMGLMQDAPYDFIMQTNLEDARLFESVRGFVHRTFNGLDLLHLFHFLQHHYLVNKQESLETAFTDWMLPGDANIERAFIGFHEYVFSFSNAAKIEIHCRKHISTPLKKSACKRLNMYLRWMVRNDETGVDFGLWRKIQPAQLICPLDVHVARVANKLRLIKGTAIENLPAGWKGAVALTAFLSSLDPADPVKYDFALFGLGVIEPF